MVEAQGIQQGENHRVLVGYLDKSSNEFQNFQGEFHSTTGDLQGELRQVRSQVADLRNVLAEFLSSNSKMNSRTQDSKLGILSGLCVLVLTNNEQLEVRIFRFAEQNPNQSSYEVPYPLILL